MHHPSIEVVQRYLGVECAEQSSKGHDPTRRAEVRGRGGTSGQTNLPSPGRFPDTHAGGVYRPPPTAHRPCEDRTNTVHRQAEREFLFAHSVGSEER